MRASWIEYVETLPWQRGYLDYSSWRALLRAASLGIDGEQALSEIAARITAAGDHPKAYKLRQQWRRACDWVRAHPESRAGGADFCSFRAREENQDWDHNFRTFWRLLNRGPNPSSTV